MVSSGARPILLTRSLALEVASRNIRVNSVLPGFIHTQMTESLDQPNVVKSIPLGRFGTPDEVAKCVEFLIDTPYMTGHSLVLDGGLCL